MARARERHTVYGIVVAVSGPQDDLGRLADAGLRIADPEHVRLDDGDGTGQGRVGARLRPQAERAIRNEPKAFMKRYSA